MTSRRDKSFEPPARLPFRIGAAFLGAVFVFVGYGMWSVSRPGGASIMLWGCWLFYMAATGYSDRLPRRLEMTLHRWRHQRRRRWS